MPVSEVTACTVAGVPVEFALSVMERLADLAPVAVGAKATVTVQLAKWTTATGSGEHEPAPEFVTTN